MKPGDFHLSNKIYGWLLQAYPPAYRAEYGPAMAQLFRDQCRDAHHQSDRWGIIKIWARILPDLIGTAFRERLAALKEMKTLNDNIAALSRPTLFGPLFRRVFVTVFLLVCIISVAITFMLPESYASTARIKLPPTTPPGNYDPYAVQTSAEIIASDIVLGPVIDKLDLNTVWGKKYNAGQPFKSAETREILKSRLEVRPVRNTMLIGIKVYSDDSREAAQIANAIAASYSDYQQSNALQIASAAAESDRKHGQSMLPASAQNPPAPSWWLVPIQVQITDIAVPGRAPVRPNKPLNIVIGSGLGLLLGAVAAILASAMAIKLRRPLRPATL